MSSAFVLVMCAMSFLHCQHNNETINTLKRWDHHLSDQQKATIIKKWVKTIDSHPTEVAAWIKAYTNTSDHSTEQFIFNALNKTVEQVVHDTHTNIHVDPGTMGRINATTLVVAHSIGAPEAQTMTNEHVYGPEVENFPRTYWDKCDPQFLPSASFLMSQCKRIEQIANSTEFEAYDNWHDWSQRWLNQYSCNDTVEGFNSTIVMDDEIKPFFALVTKYATVTATTFSTVKATRLQVVSDNATDIEYDETTTSPMDYVEGSADCCNCDCDWLRSDRRACWDEVIKYRKARQTQSPWENFSICEFILLLAFLLFAIFMGITAGGSIFLSWEDERAKEKDIREQYTRAMFKKHQMEAI